MLDIIYTTIIFTSMLVMLKLLGKYKVDNLQAIITNYFVAGVLGLFFYSSGGGKINFDSIFNASWIIHAILVGLLFIITFNLIALGSQKIGIAITMVANKMSMIVPIFTGVILYHQKLGLLQIIGILLAIFGIFLTSTNNGKLSFNKSYLWLVIVIFVGQGIADSLFDNALKNFNAGANQPFFFSLVFLTAAILGSILMTSQLIGKKSIFQAKSILWGILIGIPNYYTLYFMGRALSSGVLASSQVFPVISMGVIVLSAITGIIFFREKLSPTNWVGILLAVMAISAITF